MMNHIKKLLNGLIKGLGIISFLPKADTALVKYIFLDVEGFTRGRNVETQLDIIAKLNGIVKEIVSIYSLSNDQLIVLPTGDGLCLALIEVPNPYDLPLLISIDIIEKLDIYNSNMEDAKRRFQVRIGLSQNTDNLITDFNGRSNVAGAGINKARAIMENADGGQILLDDNIYDTLRYREKYEGEVFKNYPGKAKHGQTFNVYQYIKQGYKGLKIDPPSAFIKKESVVTEPRLPKFIAYYFAHAISNHAFFMTKITENLYEYAGVLLLFFMAQDSIANAESTPFDEPPRKRTWSAVGCTLQDQYEYYRELDFEILSTLSREIEQKYLYGFYYCFEGVNFDPKYLFINERGRTKLKNEWPEIYKEFFGET